MYREASSICENYLEKCIVRNFFRTVFNYFSANVNFKTNERIEKLNRPWIGFYHNLWAPPNPQNKPKLDEFHFKRPVLACRCRSICRNRTIEHKQCFYLHTFSIGIKKVFEFINENYFITPRMSILYCFNVMTVFNCSFQKSLPLLFCIFPRSCRFDATNVFKKKTKMLKQKLLTLLSSSNTTWYVDSCSWFHAWDRSHIGTRQFNIYLLRTNESCSLSVNCTKISAAHQHRQQLITYMRARSLSIILLSKVFQQQLGKNKLHASHESSHSFGAIV